MAWAMELNREWRSVRLSDLCDSIDYGFTASASKVPNGPRFLRITDIANGHLDWNAVPYCNIDESQEEKYKLRDKDIVLARTGASTGSSAYIGNPPYSIFASYLVRLKINNQAESRFVSYFLKSPDFKDFIHGVIGDKSAQPNASARTMTQVKVPLPPIDEQRTIAHFLGTFDDKIELNRKMNETLEAMARAIFKSWFVDFDPVRAKAEGRDPIGMDAKTAALFPDSLDNSELGRIPSGWKIGQLADILRELETGSRPRGGVNKYSEGVPSVGAESIVGLGKFAFEKVKYVPVEYFVAMKRGHVQDWDVLLYKDGGRPGEYEPHVTLYGDGFPFDEFCINEHVYRLTTNSTSSQVFLYMWLTSWRVMEEMRVKGTGVAIPGLNSQEVRSLTTLIPTPEISEAFELVVNPLISAILNNCKQSRTLSQLRDTLLPKLLSGEVRVEFTKKTGGNQSA